MAEYYKLSLLVKKDWGRGAGWEDIYFKVDNGKPEIVATYPMVLTGMLGHKLEKLSEEDTKEFLDDLHRDTGCVSIH